MMNVGLIGVGSISRVHIKAYEKIEEAKIVACCDIRPETMEQFEDARKYTDIDLFLEKEAGKLDYVDICLPTYLHKEVAVKAMKLGYDVLCEKPMARSTEEANEMIKVSNETKKRLMIAHCSRFIGAVKMMKECIESGELGKPLNAEFYREGGSKEPMGYNNWFRDESLSGGAILDLHIHDVDMMRGLFGMPEAVSVVGANIIEGAGYDSVAATYIYPDMFVSAKCDWTIKGDMFNTRTIRVNYEKGYMFVDRTQDRTIFVKVDETGEKQDLTDKIDADMYYNEILYYIDCLKNNKPFDYCPVSQSAEAVKIVEKERESANLRGEKIKL